MKLSKIDFKALTSVFAFAFLTLSSFAQCCPPPPPTGIPLDGGASILIGAAVAYGVREISKKKKI